MHKRYLSFCLIAAFSFSIFNFSQSAQAQSDSKWYLGAMAGPTATNVEGDFSGNNFKTGISGGASLGRSFGDNDNFKLQADFLFSLKGLNQTYEEVSTIEQDIVTSKTTTEFDNTLNLGYFEVPITARYSIPLGSGTFPYESRQGTTKLNIFAGPYVGYLIGAGAEFNTTRTSVVQFKNSEGEVTNENKNSGELEGGKFRVDGRNNFGTNPGISIADQLSQYSGVEGFDQVIQNVKEQTPSSYSEGISSLDVGFTAGLGLSFKIGDNNRLGFEGRISQGMMTIDEDPGAFSSVEAVPSEQEGIPFEFEYEQASLKNIQYAGYVTWTYRLQNRTF